MVSDNMWQRFRLEALIEIKNGRDYKGLNHGVYPVYGSGGIFEYVDKYLYDKVSILLPRKGSLNNIQYVSNPFWSVDTCYYSVIFSDKVDPYFLYMALKQIDIGVLNTGSAVPSMTSTKYYELEILLPSISEQRRIASALSDMDGLISDLEKLIAKKQRVKKGMMQELLTGKRRLNGFSEEWDEVELGEVVDRFDNLRIPIAEGKRKAGTIPYYGANGILSYVEGYTHDGEFILIAEDGANDLINYPVCYVVGKIWVNNHAHVLCAKGDKVAGKFLSYMLKTVDYSRFLSGSSRAKLNVKMLMRIKLKIPILIDEQRAIEKCIEDIDFEIESLSTKLAKFQHIQQGMMQELLTGKIRLPE